jgi:hypothetical protein
VKKYWTLQNVQAMPDLGLGTAILGLDEKTLSHARCHIRPADFVTDHMSTQAISCFQCAFFQHLAAAVGIGLMRPGDRGRYDSNA